MAERKRKSAPIIKIEVSKLGEETKFVTLEADSTVADALMASGYPDTSTVKIDGDTVDSDTILEDGDEIFVGSDVKGGLL